MKPNFIEVKRTFLPNDEHGRLVQTDFLVGFGGDVEFLARSLELEEPNGWSFSCQVKRHEPSYHFGNIGVMPTIGESYCTFTESDWEYLEAVVCSYEQFLPEKDCEVLESILLEVLDELSVDKEKAQEDS